MSVNKESTGALHHLADNLNVDDTIYQNRVLRLHKMLLRSQRRPRTTPDSTLRLAQASNLGMVLKHRQQLTELHRVASRSFVPIYLRHHRPNINGFRPDIANRAQAIEVAFEYRRTRPHNQVGETHRDGNVALLRHFRSVNRHTHPCRNQPTPSPVAHRDHTNRPSPQLVEKYIVYYCHFRAESDSITRVPHYLAK